MRKVTNPIACGLAAALLAGLLAGCSGAAPEETISRSPGTEATHESAAQAECSCALLYEAAAAQAADGAAQLTARESCTFVSGSRRDTLADYYYASDSEQVYCVCIVEAPSEDAAAEILQEFNDTLEATQHDSYLTTDEQKVVKAARTGRSGCYVWYLSLSADSAVVQAAEAALRSSIESAG